MPVLLDLFALADRARSDRADEVNAITDPVDGHPVSIDIDWRVSAVDDEARYGISVLVVVD